MTNNTGEVDVRVLTEIRTMGVKSDPNTVVLKLTSGQHESLYCLALSDLAGLAKQLAADAALMQGQQLVGRG
jgi:hypothetical protein